MAATVEQVLEAFCAIDEEASRLRSDGPSPELRGGLDRIVKIARHKRDMRQSAPGTCTSERAS